MKLLLLVLVSSIVCASALEPGFRVKYGIGDGVGTEFFFDLPRTLSSALVQRWRWTERAAGPLPTLELYCPDDRIICVFFDDTGYVAGIQIAIPQDEVTDAKFDFITQGYTEWAPAVVTGEIKKYWTIQQYFISEEALQISPTLRIAMRDHTKLLQYGEIWIAGFYGELTTMSTRTSEIENSIYKIQACTPGMGRHYYYNMSTETACESDTISPWFPMVYSGELVATGFIGTFKLPIKEGQRDWFERPVRSVVEAIIPYAPTCLYESIDFPGTVNLHIYFIESPWVLDCDGQ